MPSNNPGAPNGSVINLAGRIVIERPVAGQFQIHQIIDPSVGADASHMRRKSAVNERSGGRRGRYS